MSEFTAVLGGREKTFVVGGWCAREARQAQEPIKAALGGDEAAAKALRKNESVLTDLLANPGKSAEASALRSVTGEIFLKKLRELQELARAYASISDDDDATPDSLAAAARAVERLLPKLSKKAKLAVEESERELLRLEKISGGGAGLTEREVWIRAKDTLEKVGGTAEKLAETYRVLTLELH